MFSSLMTSGNYDATLQLADPAFLHFGVAGRMALHIMERRQ